MFPPCPLNRLYQFGIRAISILRILAAQEESSTEALLACGLMAGVLTLAVPAEGHLGSVRAENHVVLLAGEDNGEMVYLGKDSVRLPVAAALLNDVIGLFHPSHSWTGRFRRSGIKPRTPRFATFLTRESGATMLSATEQQGSMALLDSLIWPHGH